MKFLKLPLSMANKKDSLISRFWLAGSNEKSIHWVRRELVNHPKTMAGLGIRSTQLINDTLIFKQAMKLHNDEGLLSSKVIFSLYGCCICKKRGSIISIVTSDQWGKRVYTEQLEFLRNVLHGKLAMEEEP